jgi:hypothetical protein
MFLLATRFDLESSPSGTLYIVMCMSDNRPISGSSAEWTQLDYTPHCTKQKTIGIYRTMQIQYMSVGVKFNVKFNHFEIGDCGVAIKSGALRSMTVKFRVRKWNSVFVTKNSCQVLSKTADFERHLFTFALSACKPRVDSSDLITGDRVADLRVLKTQTYILTQAVDCIVMIVNCSLRT